MAAPGPAPRPGDLRPGADPREPRPRARPRPRPRPPPNPLFTQWLREWRDEAAAAGGGRHLPYERALRSLARYPLRLASARDAAVLRHFGPKICRRLELRLRELRPDEGSASSSPPTEGRGRESPQAPPPKLRPLRQYRPLPRSEPFALLVTLLRSPRPLPEVELRAAAQPLCARPLAPQAAPGGALGSLLRRRLVQGSGSGPSYSLTPRGRALAQRLAAAPEAPPPVEGAQASGEPPPPPAEGEAAPPPEEAEFELKPGEFDIVLCVDANEAAGARAGAVAALRRGRVPFLVRRLHVGDFLWVAREKAPPPGRPPRELALEVVVERKRAADLGASLSDGRYREQKFRLRRCGLRQPVYLLEEPRGGERLGLPASTLRQAAVSTQVVDGLAVKRTRDPRESAAFLALLGRHLQRLYGGRCLRSWGGPPQARPPPGPPGAPCPLLPLGRLQARAAKSQAQRVGDVFARQLLQ
ncbi:crossover junction endonuclease MUS81, partial [Struthio camelus]|uniref:crossover junction endonuclease MUS81 n=1 Tax=Struthio camelus TaxID=8801 RepID=UPI003603C924